MKQSKIEASRNTLTYFYLGVAGFLLLIFFLIAPTRTHFYTVEVPYEDIEYYFEKEPYEYQEAYEAQEGYETTETYSDQVPIQKLRTDTAQEGYYYPHCDGDCYCTGYNYLGNCIKCTCQYTEYETIQKERPVTKYKTVTKTRTATGYHDVQKQRTVTKLRQEQRQYEINWVFEFRVPWYLHIAYLSQSK